MNICSNSNLEPVLRFKPPIPMGSGFRTKKAGNTQPIVRPSRPQSHPLVLHNSSSPRLARILVSLSSFSRNRLTTECYPVHNFTYGSFWKTGHPSGIFTRLHEANTHPTRTNEFAEWPGQNKNLATYPKPANSAPSGNQIPVRATNHDRQITAEARSILCSNVCVTADNGTR